ncbi:hypothetical protein DL89DRAFT_315548 [Linderina pennispora]|uniref:G-protein coupled receptors family 3 profile domain-containing protein n=1 Tax=Linderina pennispora TaxID=61395 RepID=A0A1Y1WBF1_9FUNG|nr:uncharacterized protein DL89DRAFT_315546 [Linderina pennispora]XP_040744449.1 uncharacterized protein DL89DRAFT_315548 [Linderina pennispora]ORX70867.1 hypothetical protein DL89DRAFT_315546 [Linderina pennispora]ORX70870.1 hypothetical protein DL89DRAFT_315548 [Linderina pennispora]
MSDNWEYIYVRTSSAEMPVFYATMGMCLLNVPVVGYAIYNRNYLPIKSKNVWISAGMGLGMTMFCVSFNIISGMIGFEGALGMCRFWTTWMMTVFGLALFQSLINMRLIVYYRVFITQQTHSYKQFTIRKFLRRYWPFFAMWLPMVITAIVAFILPARLTVELVVDHGLNACHNNFSFLYFIIAYIVAQDIVAWVLYFRMRSVAKAFNEFKLALGTIVLFTAFVVLITALMVSQALVYSWGRIFIAFSNAILLNSYFLLILCPPIYGHMFKREECMRRFMDEMHQDGIVAQQARIGNAHKQLYGIEEGTDSYLKQSNASEGVHATYGQMPSNERHVESGDSTIQYSAYMQQLTSVSSTSISISRTDGQSRYIL